MFGIVAGITGALSAIAAGAVTVTKALAVVGMAGPALKMIGNAITKIGKALGIIKPERDVEEVGDRALQAEEKGITPEKCGSYEAWMEKIESEDWGYDPEKNKKMDSDKKVMKGIEASTCLAMEKFPEIPIVKFLSLSANNPEFFLPERMEEIGKLAVSDSDAFGKIVGYVTGTAKDHTTVDAASDMLIDIEKSINPSISEDFAYDKVSRYQGLK